MSVPDYFFWKQGRIGIIKAKHFGEICHMGGNAEIEGTIGCLLHQSLKFCNTAFLCIQGKKL